MAPYNPPKMLLLLLLLLQIFLFCALKELEPCLTLSTLGPLEVLLILPYIFLPTQCLSCHFALRHSQLLHHIRLRTSTLLFVLA